MYLSLKYWKNPFAESLRAENARVPRLKLAFYLLSCFKYYYNRFFLDSDLIFIQLNAQMKKKTSSIFSSNVEAGFLVTITE